MIYPWLENLWGEICTIRDNLPQGLLLTGPSGLGKLELALQLSCSLLCPQAVDGSACGRCASCTAMQKGAHPDLHLVTPEQFGNNLEESAAAMARRYIETPEKTRAGKKSGQLITIDQIRRLVERLGTHSHRGGARIAIIAPASRMNRNAANALLKILEEPPGDSRFILVSSARADLPATITSRVSDISCAIPAQSDGHSWLQEHGLDKQQARELLALANGAPLRALELHGQGFAEQSVLWKKQLAGLVAGRLDPIVMASRIGSDSSGNFLLWLERVLCDVVSLKFGKSDENLLIRRDSYGEGLLGRLYSPSLWDMIKRLQVYRQRQQRVVDEQLFLEDTLVAIRQEV